MKSQFYIHKEKEKDFQELKSKLDLADLNMTQLMNAMIPVILRGFKTLEPRFKTIRIDELIKLQE
jgi:hypothetical protein